MQIKFNTFKRLAIALFILSLLGVVLLNSASALTRAGDYASNVAISVRTTAGDDAADVATVYKDSKCLMCHGPTAAKFFDATLSDDALLEIVMKGKKAEKPPNMPGYEAKGMTADQAKALIAYMRSLKK